MSDLKSLRRKFELLESQGDFRLQTQAISMLLAEVKKYVAQIKAEEEAVRQIGELERAVREKPETPEQEREVAEAQEALRAAENLKRKIPMKISALRQLSGEVQDLLNEIKKAA
jgi:hypothetical protein